MKSEYLLITEEAAKKIISKRELQSVDFAASMVVVDIFTGKGTDAQASDIGLRMAEVKNGQILVAIGESYALSKNTLTVDFETFDLSHMGSAQILTAVQKLIRFSVKYWGGLSLNNNEYLPPGSTKAVIFPYPITIGASYRITAEREPGGRRTGKRYQGKHLLAYKFGTSEGDGLKEEASFTNFNKAIELAFEHKTYSSFSDAATADASYFQHVSLENDQLNTASILGLSDPYSKLSAKQIEFIHRPIEDPSRIEGPAGSGKTICMVLKCLHWLSESRKNGVPAKYLFICPSQEMKSTVKYFFEILEQGAALTENAELNRVDVKTLQDICVDFLRTDIHESEFLDEDTFEAKNIQLLHLVELVEQCKQDLAGHKEFISSELSDLFENDDAFRTAELLRHEISVVIKGRCDETFDNYKEVKRPTYGLPVKTENDRRFLFDLYLRYSDVLNSLSQFDVDDIAISAIAKLDSPIWRRRRAQEGYDAIFIDEVHLFNMNELSLVHFLTKDSSRAPISYAIDISQALGDIAWNDAEFHESIGVAKEESTRLNAVFRCSPPITDLAFSITSHGANIFTNFDNPVSDSAYIYGGVGDDLPPRYYLLSDSEDIIDQSFKVADKIKSDHDLKRHQVAIIFFDRILFDEAVRAATAHNKSFVLITKRGDIESVRSAERKSAYILCMADFVGGLEFEGVVLVGVDKGRVPSLANVTSPASRMFQSYIAHNRLYVAVTRARKCVVILGEQIRGASEVLETAVANRKLDIIKGGI